MEMEMDLEVLGSAHDGAVRQIQVLDTCLWDLLRRRDVTSFTDVSDPEFSYLCFKIDILKGVKQIYEVYRDETWTHLQQESAKSLQEVLNGSVSAISTEQDEEADEDSLLVHLIPSLLSPIEDIESQRTNLQVPTFSLMEREEMDLDYSSRD